MTSHSYYKDRLGFDPNEQQQQQPHQQSTNSMKRSSSRQTSHHHQSYHHATSSSQSPARISESPGGGGNNGSLDFHQSQREQRDREIYSSSSNNNSHHHQHHHHHHRSSVGSATGAAAAAASPLYEGSPAAPKKAKHSSTQPQPQGGYEDALTQFKGSMSIWDHFIEDWDIMHERDAIQKKTFTKWVNKHLKKHWKYAKTYTMLHVCVTTNGIPCCSQSANRRVVDLFEDLRDGHNLLSLLEVLSGEHLPREKGKMRFHMLQNAQMALDFLRYKKIKLVNIRAEDIVDGNPKLTLGLIWTIILHFQISDIVVGKEDNVSAREALLRWARRSTARYPGVRVNDFTSSWRDGLAFSALVHRNRPDLLDWRKARNDRPRDRLETAFHIVEKEYGVTRLLDPEDVDTNEPDEKSLITYISSLYDVFPEPPSIHPLFDMESQRRVHEYRDLAQQFIYWCREKTAYLQERSFPPTLIEMKRLLSDLQRFRSEEVSARKREKSKLIQIYKELERYFETVGEVDVEAELRPDAIEKAWYRMNTALQDREVILQQEIERLERLQRLADKVQREIKHVDQKLTDLETRIVEEGRRIERLHPVDAKSIVESLETEIRHLEEPIQDMNQDCHVLNEGRYPHVSELHKKVNKLHQRWAQLRTNFHTNLVQKLSGLKYPVHETTVTRQTRMVVESRQIDTNPHFRDLQDHIEWCQNKLKQLLAADYGSDLPSVKEELDRQQHEHKIIDQFHSKILNDERQQTKFTGDELNLYQQRLNQLQKVYAELLSTSTKRLSDLDSLQHFLGQASAELQWLNEKEQVEITRDWADKQLDLPSVHRYYENLMSELEKREMHFATILDRGEALLNQQHPASKCVEAHLTALQQQWAWLLQLTLCLEVHLKHATEYHQFFGEIKDAEQWLAKRDEILNSKFSQSDFGLDQGETLLRGMQDLREELNSFGETVATLQRRAQTIVPLNKRRQPVNRQGPVQAICAYKQQGQLQIEKGETVTLLDNSGRVKWRVRTAKGQEGSIPGACLLLPPPDQEAIDAAERLKRLFDRSVALWQKKHLRLRQNMIFATIRVVKGWDFDQFLAMGPEQRTAIRRALNDDADKLLSEGDPNDPQLRRLRREMDEVNRLFDEFEKRARAEEESKQASRIFTEECIAIKGKLEDMARELDQIILAPLPRDLDSLEHVLEIHGDYERRLHLLEPELKHLQETFRTIALKTPVLKKSLDNLMELWKELNTQSGLHKDRLKLLEASLAGLEDNEHVISELENELARHHDLPSTAEGLQQVFKQLTQMQDIITQQQPQMDKMNDAADQLGRMGVPTKVLGDLKRLHSNVERLNTRWSAVCNQLGERMRSCETAIGLMKNLQSSVQVEESWVDGTTERLSAMPTATSAYELDKLLGAAIERKPKIENVNVAGGRLIREAKIYDSKCLRFVDWLLEARPSFSPPRRDLRPADSDPGATQYYSQRLDNLNTKYDRLLEQLSQRLKTAIEVNGSDGLQYAESLQKPLKTFRVDFSAGSVPTGDGHAARPEDLYTTTYSTTQFSSTKTTKSSSKSIYSSDNLDPASQELANASPIGTQIQFNEIRTLKRSQQFPGGNSVLDIAGIRDPRTGRILTIGEAIQLRILDVRTGEMLVGDRRITLEQAAEQGLIDSQLARQLLQPGAGRDPSGRELSLLEVIQREISEAESGYETAEKRIKVNSVVTTEAAGSPENPCNIADAISAGSVDTKTGLYRVKSGQTISLAEAYERGYLIRHESVTIKSNALCLSDAIAHGLVDAAGWIADRNSGDKFRLDSAIANQLIDASVREVVDAKRDVKITLQEALQSGVLNAKTGRYVNEVTKEKLTFSEARSRQLIVKPYTLKDICDLNLLDRQTGKITSPMRREKLSIMQAIEVGVLDGNQLKCITKRKGELVTLQEAIADGIVLPAEVKYRDFMTGELIAIPDAVERGLISSVSQRSIFDIDGFKDLRSNDYVSFNVALSRDLLRRKSTGFALETAGREKDKESLGVPLEVAVGEGLVRQEVYEMFNRGIGVHNASGQELSVFDLVYHNLIDPKTGYLLDPKTGDGVETVPLDTAIERKFITPEGALLLSSLLNITLTTETVTRTINRYVTIRAGSQEPGVGVAVGESVLLTFTEAVRQGFIDEDRQLFKDPKTGNIYSVQQALNFGLLVPDSNQTVPEITNRKKTKSTITIVTKQILPEAEPIKLNTQQTHTKYVEKSVEIPISQELVSSSSHMQQEQNVTERQIMELPPGGWRLKDAIEQRLFNPDTGVFHVQGTDRLVSFEECIDKQIINNLSVSVLDPSTPSDKLSVKSAFERKILDSYGNYTNGRQQVLGMRSAIDEGKIVLETVPATRGSNQKTILRITRVNNMPDVLEVSTPLKDAPPKFLEVKTCQRELASPEPLQIAPGAIYDPSTALVIFTQTGETENIFDAARLGLVDEQLIRIVDPTTRQEISVTEAIARSIYDPRTATILNAEGQPVDLITATRLGLLSVVGAPLVAAEGALRTVRFVTDPRTGEQIPVEVAYERGIVSRDQRSFDSQPSPVHEEKDKVVVLQKMRKIILKPRDAMRKNIIDEETCRIIEDTKNFTSPQGEVVNISEALNTGLIDGRRGQIIDPQSNRVLNLRQAVEQKIIDPEQTNHILMPLAKSLSVPRLASQGLIDSKNQTIVHPESGYPLSIQEAIVCEVLDPQSRLQKPEKCTLEEAIEKGIINADESTFSYKNKRLNLTEAIEAKLFDAGYDQQKWRVEIPPVGMIFPVAVERSLVEPTKGVVLFPVAGLKPVPLKKAIEENYIMSIPYAPKPQAIEVVAALERGLIDVASHTMTVPATGERLSLRQALENGELVVKHLSDFVVTQRPIAKTEIMETVRAVHTVTTKTIELMQGYVLVSNNEVQNVNTGELCSLEEAKEQGILREELTTRETKAAVGEDTSSSSGDQRTVEVVEERTQTVVVGSDSHKQEMQVVSTTKSTKEVPSPQTNTKEPSKTLQNVKDAAKLGALGVIAAPVLAGGAIVSGVKSLIKSVKSPTEDAKNSNRDKPEQPQDNFIEQERKQPHPVPSDVDRLLNETETFISTTTANFIANEQQQQQEQKPKVLPQVEVPSSDSAVETTSTLTTTTVTTITTSKTTTEATSEPEPVVVEEVETVQQAEKPVTDKAKDLEEPKAEEFIKVTETVTTVTTRDSDPETKNAIPEKLTAKPQPVAETDQKKATPEFTQKEPTPEGNQKETTPEPEKKQPTPEPEKKQPTPEPEKKKPTPEPTKEPSPQPSEKPEPKPRTAAKEVLPDLEPPFTAPLAPFAEPRTEVETKVIESITEIQEQPISSSQTVTTTVTTTVRTVEEQPTIEKEVTVEREKIVEAQEVEPSVPETTKVDKPNEIVEESAAIVIEQPRSVVVEERVVTVEEPTITESTVTTTTITTTTTTSEEQQEPLPKEEIVVVTETVKEKPVEEVLLNTTETVTTNIISTGEDNKPQKPGDLEKIVQLPTATDKHQTVVDFIESEKKPVSGSNILQNVKDAAKLGALAIVGAPVLAGKALVDALTTESTQSRSGKEPLATEPQEIESLSSTTTTVTTVTTTSTLTSTESTPYDESRDVVEEPSTQSSVETSLKREVPKTLAIGDAISQKLISPDECQVIVDGEQQTETVATLLREEQLSPLDEVQIIDEKLIVLQQISYLVDVDTELTAERLSELNIYDPENQYFIDPSTGQKISFQSLVFDMNIFNPECILVKNFSTGKYETLTAALERPLLDRHTGHMVDPKTGKKIPFFECIARQWIIRSNPEEQRPAGIENVAIDTETGQVVLDDGRACSIVEAINSGKLDIQSISVRDPVSGEVIPLRMAIELGVVDMQSGTVIDIQTLKEIPMEEAFQLGFLVPGARKPISLEAAVRKGLYDPETGKLFDSESQNQVDVQKSIEIGLVDPKISLIVDTVTQKELKLDCAIEDDLVLPATGQIKDNKNNTLVPFDLGLEQHLLRTDSVTWSLPEVLQREYYTPSTGKVLNPVTGEEILLQQAIEMGFVELETTLVKDAEHDRIVAGREAARVGLLDTVRGTLSSPHMSLDEAFVKGYLISTKKPLSLVDCLLRGLYDPLTATFTIDDDNKQVDLKSAIAQKLINPDELVLLDPKTESIISITEAIAKGYLDPIGGYVINPYASTKLSLHEALENRILIPAKRKRSLPDAVYRGLYDPKTGQFSNTITREKLTTERAIRRGILDPDSTVVNVAGQIIPFGLAAERGIVDSQQGTVRDAEDNAIDFKEAFDRGVLVEAKKPLRLIEAVVKNVYDEVDGHFVDPKSGEKLNFAEALDTNLLDEHSVQIRDFKTGLYKQLNLTHAKDAGIIDAKNAKLLYNNQTMTLKHAFDIGILMDVNAPISLQRAIHQGLFDDKTGKLSDPRSGRQITLLEGMRSFVINPHLPCYFDEQTEQLYSLSETCRMGIINRREGVFREPESNNFVPLGEALSLGLIVDIENAGFGLYELLSMGFYDVATRKVRHPVTGRKLNLNEACVEDVVSLSSSLVKNHANGKYLRLANAIKEQLIDDSRGCYNLGSSEELDLQTARARGLIVSNRRLLSLELVLRQQLYRPETGKFCDPTTGEYLDLIEAIHAGFIDPASTVFKNQLTGKELPLTEAIENGDIDVSKGRVFDPKSKSAYNYDVAFARGILVTIVRPLTDRSEVVRRQDSVELLGQTPVSVVISKPREMSLEEAIRYNIIDPKTALVRDFDSFKFLPYGVAQERGLVDTTKRTLVDPKALYFAFDPTLIVYVREPVTFDQAAESKSLDLATGMLSYLPAGGSTTSSSNSDDSANDSLTVIETPRVYTLKEAASAGIVDPDSALVKDLAKAKLVRLPEAFRKGLMDANKANVLNTQTSKLCTLQEAYESGLICTPKRSFGLLEAITFNLYNPTNGCLVDPFQMHPEIIRRKKFTLAEAIASGLVDPSSTVVRDPSSGVILPLAAAIGSGLIDATAGRLTISDAQEPKQNIDLVRAAEKGLLLPAEQRRMAFSFMFYTRYSILVHISYFSLSCALTL
ncbi:plectin isoform X46 [Drosophila pseudoobscura]|uniref:Plectin isoform X46 n=1 Tax=Drosophila pseudoobscura pseudoobscura TaxID=46245 RepID=A0A6I8VQP8_DROPS|nr:plectin isoform X46 [Drosophila pseudoobscura]